MIDAKTAVLDQLVLNTVQRDAVAYDDGPQLVFAGAGTGKTRVLTAKIAFLIDRGIHPSHLFAATFTNKAAREMRERVEKFVGQSVAGMWIGTFHSLGARLLRRESTAIGYDRSFTIYDMSDQLKVMKKVLKRLDVDDRSMPPRQMLSVISRFKNSCQPPEEVDKKAVGYYEQETVRIYKTYQKLLREQQAMDFDDLLTNTVYLFRKNSAVAQAYAQRFKYLLIDEYQDTNTAQFELIKLLAQVHGRIFAVGDDDQSIYGWRGARVENILSFETQFAGTKVFKLEQNYRSTSLILNFANAAIAGNFNRAPKQLWTDRPGGEAVTIIHYRDDRQEADDVARQIEERCTGKTGAGEIAILYRTNAQSRVFEESLRKRRIPYVLVGGTGFYERAEIKDCLAYLRLLVNPRDNVSFERIFNVPARGLGEKALEAVTSLAGEMQVSLLQALVGGDCTTLGNRFTKGFTELKELFELLQDSAAQGESPDELLKSLLKISGYIDMLTAQESEEAAGRIENINELVNALTIWFEENPDHDLAAFLEEVSLVSDVDTWNQKDDAVNLMTLHCAKGLEFRDVFFVGVEDGILPSRQNGDDEAKVEEERRLLYVGATRAMERLVCSHVDHRWRFGDLIPSEPSRFLGDISSQLFTYKDQSSYFGEAARVHVPSGGGVGKRTVHHVRSDIPSKAQRPPTQPQYEDYSQDTVEFRMGQYVMHKTYGKGRIVSISGFAADMKLTILFNDGNRRKLMAKFAHFEKQ